MILLDKIYCTCKIYLRHQCASVMLGLQNIGRPATPWAVALHLSRDMRFQTVWYLPSAYFHCRRQMVFRTKELSYVCVDAS